MWQSWCIQLWRKLNSKPCSCACASVTSSSSWSHDPCQSLSKLFWVAAAAFFCVPRIAFTQRSLVFSCKPGRITGDTVKSRQTHHFKTTFKLLADDFSSANLLGKKLPLTIIPIRNNFKAFIRLGMKSFTIIYTMRWTRTSLAQLMTQQTHQPSSLEGSRNFGSVHLRVSCSQLAVSHILPRWEMKTVEVPQ